VRLAIAVVALLSVAASPRGGCGTPAEGPCAGKSCGATCNPCGDAKPCPTLIASVCDAAGECVGAAAVTCPGPASPCEGKRCGEGCTIDPPCRTATPPCLAPSLAGRCDAGGSCVAADPVCAAPAYDPCAGKACHAPCLPCAPGDGACLALACVTWCDGGGRCVCQDPAATCP
jgi:hypothetical protein